MLVCISLIAASCNILNLAGVDVVMDWNRPLRVARLDRPLDVQLSYGKRDQEPQAQENWQTWLENGERIDDRIHENRSDRSKTNKHGDFDAIRLSHTARRHDSIPQSRHVQIGFVFSDLGIRNKPPVVYAFLKDNLEEGETLKEKLAAQHANSEPMDSVGEQELVVVKVKDPDAKEEGYFRALVNEVGRNGDVDLFALDTADRLQVPLSSCRPFTVELAKKPFKAIPCLFFGISNITDGFASRATEVLRQRDPKTSFSAKLIKFKDAFNMVQVMITQGEGAKRETFDFGQKMAESGFCTYAAPSDKILVYSKDEIVALQKFEGEKPNLSEELYYAIWKFELDSLTFKLIA